VAGAGGWGDGGGRRRGPRGRWHAGGAAPALEREALRPAGPFAVAPRARLGRGLATSG